MFNIIMKDKPLGSLVVFPGVILTVHQWLSVGGGGGATVSMVHLVVFYQQ